MAKKKAEMEADQLEYEARMRVCAKAEARGLFRDAVAAALSAWPFIDGMMQYEKRYGENEFGSVPAIDIVLRYAPLLFDSSSLDSLATLLKEYKRIERNTSHDMGTKLALAKQRLRENHRLWTYLENNIDSRQADLSQSLGGDQDYWRSVAEGWERMGLLQRTPERGTYRLSLLTRMDAVTWGKCPSCGQKAEAPKGMFLESMTCPACNRTVSFVLLGE